MLLELIEGFLDLTTKICKSDRLTNGSSGGTGNGKNGCGFGDDRFLAITIPYPIKDGIVFVHGTAFRGVSPVPTEAALVVPVARTPLGFEIESRANTMKVERPADQVFRSNFRKNSSSFPFDPHGLLVPHDGK
jgi:hypothetical protein